MNESTEPRSTTGPRFRLEAGLNVLEQWAETAGQAHKNAVYRTLFKITDGSVFKDCVVFGDFNHSDEFSVLVKGDLVIKVSLRGLDAFGIQYIGAVGTHAEVDLGINPAL